MSLSLRALQYASRPAAFRGKVFFAAFRAQAFYKRVGVSIVENLGHLLSMGRRKLYLERSRGHVVEISLYEVRSGTSEISLYASLCAIFPPNFLQQHQKVSYNMGDIIITAVARIFPNSSYRRPAKMSAPTPSQGGRKLRL